MDQETDLTMVVEVKQMKYKDLYNIVSAVVISLAVGVGVFATISVMYMH